MIHRHRRIERTFASHPRGVDKAAGYLVPARYGVGPEFGAAKQYFGVPVEAERSKFVDRRRGSSGYHSEIFCNNFGTNSRPSGAGGAYYDSIG